MALVKKMTENNNKKEWSEKCKWLEFTADASQLAKRSYLDSMSDRIFAI